MSQSSQLPLWRSQQPWSGFAFSVRTRLRILAPPSPRGHDAYIAALCQEHGVSELLTHDRDFARFPGPRSRDPFI